MKRAVNLLCRRRGATNAFWQSPRVGRRVRAVVRVAHLAVDRVRRLRHIRRHGAYRIDHVARRRVFLAYADDPFAKEESMRPHVARLRAAGAQGAVTLRLVFGKEDIVRWPLEPGSEPVWPREDANE